MRLMIPVFHTEFDPLKLSLKQNGKIIAQDQGAKAKPIAVKKFVESDRISWFVALVEKVVCP